MQDKKNQTINLNNYKTTIPFVLGLYIFLGIFTFFYYKNYGTRYTRDSYHQDGVSGIMNEIVGVPVAKEPVSEAAAADGNIVLEDGTVLDSQGYVVESPYLPEGWENLEGAEASEAGEVSAAVDDTNRQYYRLKTATKKQILHLREKPSLSAAIIYRMPIGTPGYVLNKGEYWSYIVAETPKGGVEIGFAANRYMDMEEISPEEVPEEYRALPIPDYPEDPL